MSMTGYYPHAAQDFHIAGNVVLREIGRIIANLPLNIVDHRAVNINLRRVASQYQDFSQSSGIKLKSAASALLDL